MGDDITIGVTEIVNNIEVTAQPNDQIVEIDVVDNSDEVTLNITPTVIEININKGSSFARWGDILGNLPDQEDLQNVLNLKADLVGGLVPASQLPSYVDDIIEVANYAALPTTGEVGKIYVTLDNNKIFRWSGSVYIEIAANTGVWGAITGTLSSQTDLRTALDTKALKTITITPSAPLSGGGDLSANRTISISQSNATTDGYLSSIDWNKFNNNIPAGTPTTGDFVFYNGSNLAYKALLASSPLSYNSGTGTFSISQATTSTNGYLSSTDWNAFNNKVESVAASAPLGSTGGKSPVISITQATTSSNGYLSSTDWNTFNGKQTALSGTGFVKISGTTISYDNNTYALDNAVVHLAGTETITGVKTFSSQMTAAKILMSNSSSDRSLELTNSSSGQSIYVVNTGSGSAIQNLNNGNSGVGFMSANSITATGNLYQGNFNGVRVFSVGSEGAGYFAKNVGIGTTSPNYSSSGRTVVDINGTSQSMLALSVGGVGKSFLFYTGTDLLVSNESNGAIKFNTNGSEKAIITSSGNVGIGTTSPSQKLHIGGVGSAIAFDTTGASGTSLIQTVADYELSIKNNRGTSSEIRVGNESLNFYTNSVQRINVDLNGEVVLGSYSQTNNKVLDFRTNANLFTILTSATAAAGTTIYYSWANGGQGPLKFNNASSEVMRLTSSGAVCIGTTSSAGKLNCSGDLFLTTTGRAIVFNSDANYATQMYESSGNLAFQTGSSERMRITSSGRVLIGTTTDNGAKLNVVSNGKVAAFGAVGSGGDNYISFVGTSNTFDVGVTDGSFGIADSGIAYRFKVSQSGNVYVSTLGTGLLYSNAGTLTSTNPSDSRLKDDIIDLQYGLNEILKLRPVSYNWKDDKINQGKQFGFIAQEVQEVMPELVKEFETEEGERLGLDKEGIYAALVNAIKELTERINILENK